MGKAFLFLILSGTSEILVLVRVLTKKITTKNAKISSITITDNALFAAALSITSLYPLS